MKYLVKQTCLCVGIILVACSILDSRLIAQTSKPGGEAKPTQVALTASERRVDAIQFHSLASQGTGLLIPLYQYPANVHTNAAFNRLMELKRRFETIPFWVILNPGTGPGQAVDANYTKAIDRLLGSGCVVLGYVSTEYGKRNKGLVEADLDRWQKHYPRTQGIFFDEMIYQDSDESAQHQSTLSRIANEKGYWPIVSNPGADTPERYFRQRVADVIIVHESDNWPDEERIHGNYFGGYADYPSHSRGILIHSMAKIDTRKIAMISRYAKWIYVTQDQYRINDETAPNPWDDLSIHIEELCKLILVNQNASH